MEDPGNRMLTGVLKSCSRINIRGFISAGREARIGDSGDGYLVSPCAAGRHTRDERDFADGVTGGIPGPVLPGIRISS